MHYQPPSMISRWQVRSEQREQIAYHEAAHTVSYLAHGIRVEEIRLLEESDRRGFCQYWSEGLTAAAEVTSALAGQASDRMFFGFGYTSDRKIKDYAHACTAAAPLARRFGIEIERVVRFGRLAALELVDRYRRQIGKLARALVTRGALNEDEIGDIVGEVEQIHISPLIGILKDVDGAEEDDEGSNVGDDDREEDDEADGHEEPTSSSQPGATVATAGSTPGTTGCC